MNVAVLIPFGGEDRHRIQAVAYVARYYRRYFPAWYRCLVPLNPESLNKPAAMNLAVERLPATYDLLVLNDADSLVAPSQLTRAVVRAWREPGIVFAYTRYRRLDRETTDGLRSLEQVFATRDDQVEWQKLNAGSHGCIALRRECWQQAGGLDPAFGMAGYEDLAFDTVCEAFWPSRRVGGDLFHLWHPRGWDADPAREAENLQRYRDLYLANWGDREALLAISSDGRLAQLAEPRAVIPDDAGSIPAPPFT